jgi:anti-sigma factor RsiW
VRDESREDRLGELTAILDRNRNELHRLPGVIGTGVGLSSETDHPSHPVIQVFVRSPQDAPEVRRRVQGVLPQAPVEIVVTGEVTAGGDESEGSHGQT